MATISIKGVNQTIELKPCHWYEVDYYQETTNRLSRTVNPEILMFIAKVDGDDNGVIPNRTYYSGVKFYNWAVGDTDKNSFERIILVDDIVSIKEVAAPTSFTVSMTSTVKNNVNKGDLAKPGTHLLEFDATM